MDKAQIDSQVWEAADILQIEELLTRKPKQIAEGQRQRVAIGRAIVRDPKVFLFDEPLSNLDAKLRVQMRIKLNRLHQKLNATMIYVMHDQVEAMTMADKIVVLRGGYVEQVGAPLDLYHHPNNLFIAGFIGSPSMNFLDGKITGISDSAIEIELQAGTKLQAGCDPGEQAKVGDSVRFRNTSGTPQSGRSRGFTIAWRSFCGGTTGRGNVPRFPDRVGNRFDRACSR